jgi:5-methylcytosine-specific restriction protein B
MPYVTAKSLTAALQRLRATANHLLVIWFTLKQMGMTVGNPVSVTTMSPTEALYRLFYYGDKDHLYVPFGHTKRFMTMRSDAARSIVQTNIRRWLSSGSVVTVDPTSYLVIKETEDGSLAVQPGRSYPQGLGFGENGFALEENARVAIPALSFGLWYYRQHEIPDASPNSIRHLLMRDLSLSPAEFELIFVSDDPAWTPQLQSTALSEKQILQVVESSLENETTGEGIVITESFEHHIQKVKSMTSISTGPRWLNRAPVEQFKKLVDGGAKAILLYGPPRTGKTRAVDLLFPRVSASRETIQIHEGWGYDELVLGFRPDPAGGWSFREGPLLTAVRAGKSCIVLEEINRTEFSQAIGEVLSLLEDAYRGEQNQIRLRNGEHFFIPHTTLIVCTMNSLDKSTEEIDDAVLGRMDAVEFPPRVEDLYRMLHEQGIDEGTSTKFTELFSTIGEYYPLGHGYFAPLKPDTDAVSFYLSRIRPVLQKRLAGHRDIELASIDEKVEQLFG